MLLAFSKASLPSAVSEAQNFIKTAIASCPELSLLRELVRFCRVALTFDKKAVKIQMWTENPLRELTLAIQSTVVTLGGEVKYGSPPRTVKERRVASLMAKFAR